MKKLIVLFATMAMAFTLSAPAFAKKKKKEKKEHTVAAHKMHSKKKGTKKGKKEGQEGTNPGK